MGERARPVVLVFLLLAAVSASLALRAWLLAPKGTVFVGTFYYVDDFYNYLSYVEQAERGAVVFRNKLVDPSRGPSLVNLEWLAVGWLSALLGGSPLVAYRVFGLAALAALIIGADRWLARCGLAASRRLAGLLLVFTGGGFGGALLALGRLPGERAFDVRTGAFPFVEAIANPTSWPAPRSSSPRWARSRRAAAGSAPPSGPCSASYAPTTRRFSPGSRASP